LPKFSTVFGAASEKNSRPISPKLVVILPEVAIEEKGLTGIFESSSRVQEVKLV
jgi:hypothetical protein